MMTLGEKLRRRRKRLKKSAKELADYLDVNVSTYYKYEGGQILITEDKLMKLAEIFGVTMDFFTDVADDDDLAMVTVDIIRISDGEKVGNLGIPYNWTSHSRRYAAFKVDDDRLEPYCPENGTAIVRLAVSDEDFEDGDYVAIRIKGRTEIGRGYHMGEMTAVSPLNDKAPLVWGSGDDVYFIGFLVETRRPWA